MIVSNNVFVICRGKGVVWGLIKVGRKRLFLSVRIFILKKDVFADCCYHGNGNNSPPPLPSPQDGTGIQQEVEPICVLDFYVHESKQRSGCGKMLFEAMLQVLGGFFLCQVSNYQYTASSSCREKGLNHLKWPLIDRLQSF